MTKEEILKGLSERGPLTEAEISQMSPVSPNRLRRMMRELVFEGKVSYDGEKYTDIRNSHLELAKCVTKKAAFVYLNLVREDHMDVRLTGEVADKMLIGDYCYVYCDIGKFGPRDCKFFCDLQPITQIKGNYRLGTEGAPELVIPYLEVANVKVLVTENAAKDVGIGDFVSATILERQTGVIKVRIDKLLVKAGNVGADISQIIAANDAPMDFPQEVIDEAKAIPQQLVPDDYKDRKDLRDEVIVTVDGEDSRDFDDAVSGVRTDYGWEVGIHIADVAHYVKPGHPLDSEAQNRGTSIYVADRVVPMLPVELSNGICSLNPNVDRLTLTCRAKIDKAGNVISSEVYPSVIRSHGRLTYTQVNELIHTGDCDSLTPEVKSMLGVLKECADAVRARREKQGAMKLDSVELHFTLDEKGFPTAVSTKQQDDAEKLIEDLMIVANCEVAKLLHKLNIPTLYRIHELPPEEKFAVLLQYVKKLGLIKFFPPKGGASPKALNDFMNSIQDPNLRKAVSIVMLRSMAKARYSPDEVGHFGLAEPEYLHFTSPIRRYPDTIVHRCLHDYVFEHKPFDRNSLYDHMKDLGDSLSADEKRAQTIERSVDDLESSKYMSVRISEKFHGFIVSFLDFGMFVQLDNGIEGLLPFEYINDDRFFYDDRHLTVKDNTADTEYNLGQEIDVCVFSCNVQNRKITFCSPEFMETLGRNLTPEQLAMLKANNVAIMTESEYLAKRHQDYLFTHRRPRSDFRGSNSFRGSSSYHGGAGRGGDRGGFRRDGNGQGGNRSGYGYRHDDRNGSYRSNDRGGFRRDGQHSDFHRDGGNRPFHRDNGYRHDRDSNSRYGHNTHFRRDDDYRFNKPEGNGSDNNNPSPASNGNDDLASGD